MLTHIILSKSKNIEKGFTLIELLVVTIIVGILTAVSMPSLLGQIAKARETEATNQLGVISRSQQVYHFETKEFAPDMSTLDRNISITDGYYQFPDPVVTSDTVKHQAIATARWTNSSRDYAIGIYHNTGEYTTLLCRASTATSIITVPNNSTDPCNNNGIRIR